jgi:C1A family cysteine protease
LILVLSFYLVATLENTHDKQAEIFTKFQEFLTTEDRKYKTIDEYLARFKVFSNNIARLEAFNNDKHSTNNYSVGITKFFDMTPQEFRRTYLNLKVNILDTLKAESEKITFLESTAPDSFDWRTQGAVGPVKDQGACGSCWAFSTVGNIEGINYIKSKTMVQYSEQQLVDCDDNGDEGCNGGLMENAFGYLQKTGGIMASADYKYTARDQKCKFDKTKVALLISGFKFAGSEDEEQIKQFLYETGPLAIALNADPLQFYNGGIIDDDAEDCDPQGLNHGVTLIGYGVEKGVNYWIVKNSWGNSWGEKGYFRMARGKGTCGINTYVTSATLQ